MEYYNAVYKEAVSEGRKRKLVEDALKGKTLVHLQMGKLDEALQSARMFVHQVTIVPSR